MDAGAPSWDHTLNQEVTGQVFLGFEADGVTPILGDTVTEVIRDRNGDPNPNFGCPVIQNGAIGLIMRERSDEYRFTGTYKLDLEEKVGKWFGKHNLIFHYNNLTTWFKEYSIRDIQVSESPDYYDGPCQDGVGVASSGSATGFSVSGVTNCAGSVGWDRTRRRGWTRSYYVGPAQSGAVPPRVTNPPGLLDHNFCQSSKGPINAGVLNTHENVHYFLNYRVDDMYEQGIAPPGTQLDENSYTYGIVGHPTKWLSAYYNESSNFRAQGLQVNLYAEALGPKRGEGKDCVFSLFKGKIHTRVNWFEVAKYTFGKGFLKGFNLGGAMLWNDTQAIGFPITEQVVDGRTVDATDLDNPYFGDADTFTDLWFGYKHPLFDGKVNWKIQMNTATPANDVYPSCGLSR